MTCEVAYDLPNGKTWKALSGTFCNWVPHVAIPIDQLDGMTNEEIGVAVRSSIRQARRVWSIEKAGYYLHTLIFDKRGNCRIDDDEADDIEIDAEAMREFRAEEEAVDNALAVIDDVLRKHKFRRIARDSKPAKRMAITSNHDKLLTILGKRDGFKCAKCGSPDKLQIDHIVPLALNGSNDLDNLQILCQPCNGSKHDRVEDYRSNGEAR